MSWPMVKLGDCGKFQAGNGFPLKYQGKKVGKYPFVKVGDISACVKRGDVHLNVAGNYIDEEDLLVIKGKIIPTLSILFAKIGEAIRLNNRAISSKEMLIDNNSMAYISDKHKVDYKYAYFFFKQLKLYDYAGKTTVPALRKSDLEQIKIPLPPLDEQKRIAAILDKADAIRQKRKQTIALADDFLRSVFLDMFGDPITNPKGFPLGYISDLVDTAKYGSSAKASETEGEYPILRMGNITYKGAWNFSSLKFINLNENEKIKYLAYKGDLLFNRTNSKELVGKTAVYEKNEPMAFAGYLVRVRSNCKGNNYYISGYLNSNHGKKTLLGMCKSIVGMANINAKELQCIKILLPPVELQSSYEQIVKAVRIRLEKQLINENNLHHLFAALSQRAFSGQL